MFFVRLLVGGRSEFFWLTTQPPAIGDFVCLEGKTFLIRGRIWRQADDSLLRNYSSELSFVERGDSISAVDLLGESQPTKS